MNLNHIQDILKVTFLTDVNTCMNFDNVRATIMFVQIALAFLIFPNEPSKSDMFCVNNCTFKDIDFQRNSTLSKRENINSDCVYNIGLDNNYSTLKKLDIARTVCIANRITDRMLLSGVFVLLYVLWALAQRYWVHQKRDKITIMKKVVENLNNQQIPADCIATILREFRVKPTKHFNMSNPLMGTRFHRWRYGCCMKHSAGLSESEQSELLSLMQYYKNHVAMHKLCSQLLVIGLLLLLFAHDFTFFWSSVIGVVVVCLSVDHTSRWLDVSTWRNDCFYRMASHYICGLPYCVDLMNGALISIFFMHLFLPEEIFLRMCDILLDFGSSSPLQFHRFIIQKFPRFTVLDVAFRCIPSVVGGSELEHIYQEAADMLCINPDSIMVYGYIISMVALNVCLIIIFWYNEIHSSSFIVDWFRDTKAG